jgi:hypothetical protein
MYHFTPFACITILLCAFAHLFVSATPVRSRQNLSKLYRSNTNSDMASLGLPLGQCRNFIFEDNTLSAFCEVQREDAGPPEIVPTKIQLSKCIANEEGNMVYRTE